MQDVLLPGIVQCMVSSMFSEPEMEPRAACN